MSAVRLLPWVLHKGLEYLAGIFLVLAPLILDVTAGAAVPVLVGAGVVVLVLAMLTRGTLGVVGLLPTALHALLDYLVAFSLILSPFLFGFSGDEPALYTAVLVGVAHLVITLTTRYPLPAAGGAEADQPEAGSAGAAPAAEQE